MFKIFKISSFLMLLSFPVFANAAGLTNLIDAATGIITSTLIPLTFALCLLFFFWGIVKYIWSVGNEKEEGRKVMIWGIIGLFVVSSIWGIIKFIQTELGVTPIQNISIQG